MRKPNVKNKYNLTPRRICELKVNREKLGEPLFWRNNVINAWCVCGSTAKSSADREFGTYNSYWLGVYDEDAELYPGKIRLEFSSYGGMCSLNFKRFYSPYEIETEEELEIQEKLLANINSLIDEGVFTI